MTGRWNRRRLVLGAAAAFSTLGAAAMAGAPTRESTPRAGTPGATPMAATPAAVRILSVAQKVTIELTDNGFQPQIVQSTNGHDLDVTLVNTDIRRHAFQIDRLNIDVALEPGERKTVTISSPPLGEFAFTSDTPGDEKFSGTLVFYI